VEDIDLEALGELMNVAPWQINICDEEPWK
jgi:hypothetical protein